MSQDIKFMEARKASKETNLAKQDKYSYVAEFSRDVRLSYDYKLL